MFQWQAQTPGDVIIDTFGSSFDTILYLIDDCTATNSTFCNDDFTNGILTLRQSRIRVTVATGEVLNVVLDGFATPSFGVAAANFTALGCVDDDTTAIPRNVGPSVFTGTLGTTSDDDMSSSCAGTPEDGPDAVHAWEAPASGTFTFSTEGSAFDTVLYLRRSCDAEDPRTSMGLELACNDDTPTALQSRASASLLAGQTVLIAIESIGGGGAYQIGISGP